MKSLDEVDEGSIKGWYKQLAEACEFAADTISRFKDKEEIDAALVKTITSKAASLINFFPYFSEGTNFLQSFIDVDSDISSLGVKIIEKTLVDINKNLSEWKKSAHSI